MPATFQISSVFTAVDRYTAPLRRMAAATMGFRQKAVVALNFVDRKFAQVNRRLSLFNKNLKRSIALAGAMALAVGVGGGATAFLELDKNISAASAKFGVFDRQSDVFQQLRQTALDFGATTEFTAAQAAEGLKNLATAGFNAEQAIAALPQILDLATATQSDLGMASEVAAKSLRAFGLFSKDPLELNRNLGLVNNTLNKIITTSGFGSLDEFLDVISQSGSVARAAGVDVQTWAAVVASSVSEAVPASKAGTRFANMLSFMSKNIDKFTRAGIQVADSNGNYRDFIEIMKDVEKVTAGLGSVEKAGVLFELFGERGSKMAQSILENGIPAIEQYREEVRNANTITADMASFMRTGLTGAVNAAKSAFEAVSIAVGDTFQKEIDATILKLIEVARGAKAWLIENKKLVKGIFSLTVFVLKAWVAFKIIGLTIAAVKAAIIGFNVVLGVSTLLLGKSIFMLRGNAIALAAYSTAGKVVTAVQWAWNAAMMANPIGLIIAAVVALIGVIAWAIAKYDEWGAALLVFMGPIGFVINAIQSFRRNWEMVVNAFKTEGIIGGLKAIALTILDSVLIPIRQVLELIDKFTGFDFAKNGISFIDKFRQLKGLSIDGPGLKKTPPEGAQVPGGEPPVANVNQPASQAANVPPATDRATAANEATKGAEINLDGTNQTLVLPPGIDLPSATVDVPANLFSNLTLPEITPTNPAITTADNTAEILSPGNTASEVVNPKSTQPQDLDVQEIQERKEIRIIVVDERGNVLGQTNTDDNSDITVNLDRTFKF